MSDQREKALAEANAASENACKAFDRGSSLTGEAAKAQGLAAIAFALVEVADAIRAKGSGGSAGAVGGGQP